MAWDQAQVQQAQNALPTDFAALDSQLAQRNDFNSGRFANDDKLHVVFYMRPWLNEEKSVVANRPIYEDKEYIRILIPGDKQNIVDRVAEDFDRQRFPTHYAKFKAGVEQITGTPLLNTGIFSPAKCEEYVAIGIRTAEQMAGAADNLAPRIMGFHGDKQAAQRWLDKQQGTEVLASQIDALKAELAQLRELSVEHEQKRGPGRPKRAVAE